MEPDAQAPASQPASTASTASSIKAGTSVPAYIPTDNQFVEALRASIKTRQTALTALTSAAEKLTAVIPDPNMRLKAAFEMVKSDGRGVKELLEAITVHTADLESQKLQFARAMELESSRSVGNLRAMTESLSASTNAAQAQIKSFHDQIAQLTGLINENTAKVTASQNQIDVETSRLSNNSIQFDAALVMVKAELDNQRNIIQSSLS